MREELGRYIREFRRKRGVSQREMSEILDISQKQVSLIEAGKAPVSQFVREAMIDAGIIPESSNNVPDKVKKAMDVMRYEDQLMLYHMAMRLKQ